MQVEWLYEVITLIVFVVIHFTRLKHRWEDVCAFRVFPYKLHTSLQFFELADDYIQQEIRKPSTQTTCTVSFMKGAKKAQHKK